MGTGHVARRADRADDLTGGDPLTRLHGDAALVGVPEHGAVVEAQLGLVAVRAVVPGRGDHARGHGAQRRALGRGEVQPRVGARPQAARPEPRGESVVVDRQAPRRGLGLQSFTDQDPLEGGLGPGRRSTGVGGHGRHRVHGQPPGGGHGGGRCWGHRRQGAGGQVDRGGRRRGERRGGQQAGQGNRCGGTPQVGLGEHLEGHSSPRREGEVWLPGFARRTSARLAARRRSSLGGTPAGDEQGALPVPSCTSRAACVLATRRNQ